MEQLQQALAILRLKQLEEQVGLKRSSIYEKMNPKSDRYDPTFPVMVSLGERSVGWYAHEVDEWLESLQRKRGGE
jgi:prophage regulatory protein